MLKKHSVEGFDDFKSKVEELAMEGLPLIVHFSGSKVNGKQITKSSRDHSLAKVLNLYY